MRRKRGLRNVVASQTKHAQEERGCARPEYFRSLASSWVFLPLPGSAWPSYPARGSWCVSLPRCTGSGYPCHPLSHHRIRWHPPQTLLSRGSRALSPIRRSCRESYRGLQPHWPSLPDGPLTLTDLRASRSMGAKEARVSRARSQIRFQILNHRHQIPSLQDRQHPKFPPSRMVSRSSFQVLPLPLNAPLHSRLAAGQAPMLLRTPGELAIGTLAHLAVRKMTVRCPLKTEAVAKTSPAPWVLWPGPLTLERMKVPPKTLVMRPIQGAKGTKQTDRTQEASPGLASDQAWGVAAEATQITVERQVAEAPPALAAGPVLGAARAALAIHPAKALPARGPV
jgi:hypothetical protein